MGARLGQHFLKHGWAARALAHAARPQSDEVIVEIGPGKGVLTRELLARGNVIAVEKDEALVQKLHETFVEEIEAGKLKIVPEDVRDFDPASYKLKAGQYIVGANIPYYITGEIIRQFLSSDVQPRTMALLVQKEVAQRIVSDKESILSLSVKAYGTPKIIEKVSRIHFSPQPKVDSAIIVISDISKKFFNDISESDFFRIVRAGFASKRKFVLNNLAVIFDKEKVASAFRATYVDDKARAEDISLEQWKYVVQILTSQQ